MALLRLLTNASVLGKDSKTQAEAWNIYDALRNSPRVAFVDIRGERLPVLLGILRKLVEHQVGQLNGRCFHGRSFAQ